MVERQLPKLHSLAVKRFCSSLLFMLKVNQGGKRPSSFRLNQKPILSIHRLSMGTGKPSP
jgi:hypothetical protein